MTSPKASCRLIRGGFIYLYIYMRTSALVIWIYGKTERRIEKTTMPDECNFDSATYVQKIESRVPFQRSTQLEFLSEKSEMTLDFAPVQD